MTRRHLSLLVGLGVAVLVALVGLRLLTQDADAPTRGDRADRADPKNHQPSPSAGTPHMSAPGPRPQLAESGSGSTPEVKEYMVGDVRVRDHRTGDRAPLDVPPAIHPPGGRQIASTITADLAEQLRVALGSCATSAPASSRGAKPRVEGTISIAIKAHEVKVMRAAFQARDLDEAASAAVRTCVEQQARGLATTARDEADVDDYDITMSLRLP